MNTVVYWLYWQKQVVATIEAERDLNDHEVRMRARTKHLEAPFGETWEMPHERERKIITADVKVAA